MKGSECVVDIEEAAERIEIGAGSREGREEEHAYIEELEEGRRAGYGDVLLKCLLGEITIIGDESGFVPVGIHNWRCAIISQHGEGDWNDCSSAFSKETRKNCLCIRFHPWLESCYSFVTLKKTRNHTFILDRIKSMFQITIRPSSPHVEISFTRCCCCCC